MDKDELKKLKGKSIFFLLFGIISFIMSFLIPFLWVFSAMAFYIAYENFKEYRQLRKKEDEINPQK